MHKKFYFIFFLILTIDLLAMFYFPSMRLVTKPLIMASLLTWYILSVRSQDQLLMTGMIFATIGDLLLEFEFQISFILGLSAFLIMQVCYTLVFKRNFAKPSGWKWWILGLIYLVAIGFLTSYWHNFKGLGVYIGLYTIAIATMVSFAICRKTTYMLQQPLIVGVLLFMFSDLVLAINMFVEKIMGARLLIMVSYAAAQLLIISSLVQESKAQDLSSVRNK